MVYPDDYYCNIINLFCCGLQKSSEIKEILGKERVEGVKIFSKLNPKKWFKKKEEKSEVPDWVKKVKEREKTK